MIIAPILSVVALVTAVGLVLLAIETVREFRRMGRRPDEFSGSDRLAGTAE
jgi:hypothetical protein